MYQVLFAQNIQSVEVAYFGGTCSEPVYFQQKTIKVLSRVRSVILIIIIELDNSKNNGKVTKCCTFQIKIHFHKFTVNNILVNYSDYNMVASTNKERCKVKLDLLYMRIKTSANFMVFTQFATSKL